MQALAVDSPAAPETTFALRATARPHSGKGRAIAKRRRNSAAFRKKVLKTLCFDSFILKPALETDAQRLF
jgi:hypothetical protein